MNSLDVTADFTSARLRQLDAKGVVRAMGSEATALSGALDYALASIENKLIERTLIGRLRKALNAANSEAAARKLIAQFRGAYASGEMETLPSFLPSSGNYGGAAGLPKSGSDHSSYPGILRKRPTILYTVGGGFIMPPSRKQKIMVQRLAENVHCEVVLGHHRLAPEFPFPAAAEDIAGQFLQIVNDGKRASNIVMGADSAGASVTLGALQMLREKGEMLPAGVVLFSPWCDLSLSGWSYIARSITSESPFRMETAAFCARLYLRDKNPTDPVASAVFGDMRGMPPMLIHTSRHDLHFDDALRLAENGHAANCDVRLNYWASPRHHLERLASDNARKSFQLARAFIDEVTGQC